MNSRRPFLSVIFKFQKLTEGSKVKVFVSSNPTDPSLPSSMLMMPGKYPTTENSEKNLIPFSRKGIYNKENVKDLVTPRYIEAPLENPLLVL